VDLGHPRGRAAAVIILLLCGPQVVRGCRGVKPIRELWDRWTKSRKARCHCPQCSRVLYGSNFACEWDWT
jgi:hypothetical protein